MLATFLYGCSGGLSCGGEAGEGCLNGYAYPQSDLSNGVEKVSEGAKMRMTQAALDFLDGALKDILISSLGESMADPNTIAIELPPTQLVGDGGGIGDVALGEGEAETYPTTLLIDASEFSDKIEMQFVEAGDMVSLNGNDVIVEKDGILLDVIGLPVGIDARIFTRVSSFGIQATAGCDLDGTNPDFCPPGNPECGTLTSLDLGILVYPEVATGAACDVPTGECLTIDVDVVHADISGIDSGDLDISVPPHDDDDCGPNAPPLCSPECSDQNTAEDIIGLSPDWECDLICAIEEFSIDLLVNLIGFIEPLIDTFFDEILTNAIKDALADFDGAPIAVSTTFDLSETLGDMIPRTSAELGYSLSPTGDAFQVDCASNTSCDETTGMNFTINSGFEAAPHAEAAIPHPCVAATDEQAFQMLFGGPEFATGPSPILDGMYDGSPYHLGASISEAMVRQAVYGVYNAGGLCLSADSDRIYQLSGGAFPFSVGTVDLLVEGKLRNFADPEAPAIVTLTPREPPVIDYGAGTENDGHINFTWTDVDVGFYALAYERFAQVFSVRANLSASASVLKDPETNTLKLSIVSGPEVSDIREIHNEFLPEVDFVSVLEALTAVALDAALGNGLEFDLDFSDAISEALGVDLTLNFDGIETVPENAPDFLNLYLSLAEGSGTNPQMLTNLRPLALSLAPEPGLFATGDSNAPSRPTGTVRVVTADGSSLPTNYEYFAQVDFGMLRGPFRADTDDVLEIHDARLTLLGEHTIHVRRRPVGVQEGLSWPPSEVTFQLDPIAPKINIDIGKELIELSGSDIGSPSGELMYAIAWDDQDFGDYSTNRKLERNPEATRLRVRTRDAAGNTSTKAIMLPRVDFSTNHQSDMVHDIEAAGCSSSSTSHACLTLLLLPLLAATRRRQK